MRVIQGGAGSTGTENSEADYTDYVVEICVEDQEYDEADLRKTSGACNFPLKHIVEQVRGTRGPRFYNKMTPTQVLVKLVNISRLYQLGINHVCVILSHRH